MSKKGSEAIVLVNLGSPASPGVPDVAAFLKDFLNDACVLTMPALIRHLLVKGIIAPYRAPRSAAKYKQLWDERGSPLIYHSIDLMDTLVSQDLHGYALFLAMRYGPLNLRKVLGDIMAAEYSELLIIPLFPHYTSSTVGSIMEEARRVLKGNPLLERSRILLQFHDQEGFSGLWADKIRGFLKDETDALVLSFHGIPISHAQGSHREASCSALKCEEKYGEKNRYCYRAACHHTGRQISARLAFPVEKIHHAYQSRFGRRWLGPQTGKVLVELARSGCRNVVVACPSFVADCLETNLEVGMEYKEAFLAAGGETLELVPSLNADLQWARFLLDLISRPRSESLPLSSVHCRGSKLCFE